MYVEVNHIDTEFPVGDLGSAFWDAADEVPISYYWSGIPAPESRHAAARMLWSPTALYVRFYGSQREPLVVSEVPDTSRKTPGVWDRDVCEVYIAPDRTVPNRYYEFEVAPNGEWIDLRLEITSIGRSTDWEYNSGMESAARVGEKFVMMAIKVPFAALGATPSPGDIWLGNLFRCVGEGTTRGYLAWRPTRTERPSFHSPAAFGEFHFK